MNDDGRDDVIEVTAVRPANGGEVVAHHEGRVVFVRGAIPGERVRARITDDRHVGYLRAEMVEVLDASPFRTPVACAAAAHGGGCCDLSFVDVAHMRDLKAQVLTDVLTRIGGLTTEGIDAVSSADLVTALDDDPTGWRIRTRLGVDADGRAGVRAFHGSEVIAGYQCIQPAPSMLAGLDDLAATPGSDLAVVTDMTGARHVVEVAPAARRSGTNQRGTNQRGTNRGGRDRRRAAQKDRRAREQHRATRVLEGDQYAAHAVGERIWRIPVTGFWQAHRAAPSTYSAAISAMLADVEVPTNPVAWDLYGGAGVFAAALLDSSTSAAAVHVVDSDAGALQAAADTFADDGRIVLHHGEVAASLADLPTSDVVVADPPRTGAGERVVSAIVDAHPAAVVLVGCDAGRFARDLALFARGDYRVVALQGFDAFPQTHHVEAIACLVPGRAPS